MKFCYKVLCALLLFLPAGVVLGLNNCIGNKKICIVGGGPTGLYFAALVLQQEPTANIVVLEKSPRYSASRNAFGIGLNRRIRRCLDEVPGLSERVYSVSAPVTKVDVSIARRNDIAEQMASFLEERYSNDRICLRYEEGLQAVDLDSKCVTTTAGYEIRYDLLIGADGITSKIREHLVSVKGLKKEHYLQQNNWKALFLPTQPSIEPGSFKPLVDSRITGGRVIPRYPDGHLLLVFWKGHDGDNPAGIGTVDALKDLVISALSTKEKDNWFRRSIGIYKDNEQIDKNEIIFNEPALQEFVDSRPGKSHYMKLDRYHDESVALVGDSAHGMYTMLGQGLACALESSRILARCLCGEKDLNIALAEYSRLAVPEGHAITDLNLIGHVMTGGPFLKIIAMPITLIQSLRGKMLFKRVNEDVSFQQVLKENKILVALSKWSWKKNRIPF